MVEEGREQKEESSSLFQRLLSSLRSTSKYYTGYPKLLGPPRVLHFTSERHFVQLLHEGAPIVVAFTIKCPLTKHLDRVLEEAAAEFYPHIKFVRVECPKYPGFCIARQKKEYPFIEIFHSPEQALAQGRVIDPNITKYSVKVLPDVAWTRAMEEKMDALISRSTWELVHLPPGAFVVGCRWVFTLKYLPDRTIQRYKPSSTMI